MERHTRKHTNFPIFVKRQLIFPIPCALAPFPKRGARALLSISLSVYIRDRSLFKCQGGRLKSVCVWGESYEFPCG